MTKFHVTSRTMRWVLAGTVALTGLTVAESPADAAPAARSVALQDVASVRFDPNGDHFYLCDHAEDGKSVAVEFYWTRESTDRREFDRRWNWWGPHRYNGCKDINIDAVEGTQVDYRVCIGDYAEPGGQPAVVRACSGWTAAAA